MDIQDLINAIPNKEDVDAVFINAVFVRLQNLSKLTEMAKDEAVVLTEHSREGHPRVTKNPFWDVYRNEMAGCSQNLAELNLTPRSRKTLLNKVDSNSAPRLG